MKCLQPEKSVWRKQRSIYNRYLEIKGKLQMSKLKTYILNEIYEGRIDRADGKEMLEALHGPAHEPIAIIGMAAILPQADRYDDFWQNLSCKITSVREFPDRRRAFTDDFLPQELTDDDEAYQRQGYLEDVTGFDPAFFGLSDAEGDKMSPLQRLVLECSWKALHDAGYGEGSLSGKNVSVCTANARLGEPRYSDFMEITDGTGFIGNTGSVLPSRLAYRMGFTGPCAVIDAACSSGLLAVSQACESLRRGETEASVVCGSAINLFPLAKDRVVILESPDSEIHPFDSRANGTVWGEGVCAVMLKRYQDACNDGDRIYAVISANGTNNDGTSNGITTPDMLRQKELMTGVWKRFGTDVEKIGYFEAHGTGTQIGDPIEIRSISEAMSEYTKRRQFCAIGTCKKNIGHLVAASGIVALMKCALSLYHGQIPPMPGFEEPNGFTDFCNSPLYVCDEHIKIPEGEEFHIAVNSFGISGTNVHVILDACKTQKAASEKHRPSSVRMNKREHRIRPDSRHAWIQNGKVISWGHGKEQRRLTMTKNKWYINEHTVIEKPTMPASAILELIYLAGQKQYHGPVEIKEFVLTGLLTVCSKREIIVRTEKIGEETEVQILAEAEGTYESEYDRRWVPVAGARVLPCNKPKHSEAAAPVLGKSWFNANDFTGGKIVYGPRWDCVDTFEREDNRCRIHIKLGKAYASDLKRHPLHPAMLDLALNGLAFLQEGDYLPFHIGSIRIYREFGGDISCEIRENLDLSSDEAKSYDIGIYDEEGPLADVLGYVVKKVDGLKSISPQEDCFLEWVSMEEIRETDRPLLENCCCIMPAADRYCEEIAALLPGSRGFAVAGSRQEIADAIEAAGTEDVVLLLPEQSKDAQAERDRVILPVFAAASAAAGSPSVKTLTVVSVTESCDSTAAASVGALVRSAGNEMPEVCCRHIIVCKETDTDRVLSEIICGNETEWAVCQEARMRPQLSVRTLQPQEHREKSDGICMITGASGGLGGELAEKLCSQAQVLILTSRRGIHSGQLEQTARRTGTVLKDYSADVSDRTQMEALCHILKKDNCFPDCIYHLAGIADGQFLGDYTEEKAVEVMNPKILGVQNLYRFAKDTGAGSLILVSSVSGLIGTPGQGAYSAANAYMNAFAGRMSDDRLKIISLVLPAVTQVGMAAGNAADYDSVFHVMTPEQAVEHLLAVRSRAGGVYCPASLNYSFELLGDMKLALSRQIRSRIAGIKASKTVRTKHAKLKLTGRADGCYTESELKLAEIWYHVLGAERVDIDTSFFEAGGDSVMAISMANKISDMFHKKMDMSSLFKFNTIRKLAERIDEAHKNTAFRIPAAPVRKNYPLSGEQRRIYAIQSFDNESIVYNMPVTLELNGKIEAARMENAFRQVISASPSLRTKFYVTEEGARQEICDGSDYRLEVLQYDHELKPDELENTVRKFVRPFDMSGGMLLRTMLIQDREQHGYITVDVHHIAADGYAMSVLLREFIKAYSGLEVTVPSVNYVDFAVWSLGREDEAFRLAKEYWHRQFSDEIPVLELPARKKRPSVKSGRGGLLEFEIPPLLAGEVKELAKSENATVGLVLLCGFAVMLAKYSRQDDIVIGVPYAGRENSELENVIGMFVNTLPIRLAPENRMSVREFLEKSKERYVEGMKNSSYRISELMGEISQGRDTGRNPLFDVMFAFQNTSGEIEITDVATPRIEVMVDKVSIRSVAYRKQIAKLDLTLEVIEREEGFSCNFEYNADIFDHRDARRFAESYLSVVRQFTAGKETGLFDISVISEEEKKLVTEVFNNTDYPYSQDQTVISLFERQAKKTPEAIAVEYREDFITYQELNERANALGMRLREAGVKPDDFVAVRSERCIEMIIGIFGILKCAAAYLPISPSYPKERTAFMLKDSGAAVMLLQNDGKKKEYDNVRIIYLDELRERRSGNLPQAAGPENFAYMIYTSGTTGRPKGVMCHNRGLVNRIEWMQRRYPIGAGDAILQKTTYTFDVSVWEIIWWSLVGAKVVLLEPGGERDPEMICSAVEKHGITVMHFVPSMLNAFLTYLSAVPESVEKLRSLKHVFASGEVLKREHASLFYRLLSPGSRRVRLANFYGPTEASIDVTAWDCLEHQEILPIGKPIDNIRIYIMNGSALCGPGVSGELCITGVGVAGGYRNLDELTAKRFVPNPFGSGRMYLTGDLARWMPDGNIEYLGRLDEQVKIRGFRIEPAEIERVICRMEEIKTAVVTAASDRNGDKYLCAYIVSDDTVDVGRFREKLKSELPDYMVPAAVMQLAQLPVTGNGKLNRKALPVIETEDSSECVMPRTEEEIVLVQAVSQILGRKNISVEDDFFRTGGDSIKAIQLSSKLRELGYSLSIQSLYECSSIREMALRLKGGRISPDWEEVTGSAPLLPIQKELLSRDMPNVDWYNQEVVCFCREKISASAMDRALNRLVRHHDALRMIFPEETPDEQVCRPYQGEKHFLLLEHTLDSRDHKALTELLNDGHSRLCIRTGVMFVCMVIHTPEEDVLMLIAHHLICDGVSWRIILEDLEGLYIEETGGESYALPPKTTSYRDWCQGVADRAESGLVWDQLPYWSSVCRPCSREVKYLCRDRKRQILKADEATCSLLAEHISRIRKLTINEVVLCAVAEAAAYSGIENPGYVMLESHGREEISSQLCAARTAGWFTTVYPFALPRTEGGILDRLADTKEKIRRIPAGGFDYGILRQMGAELCDSDILVNCMGDFSRQGSLFEIVSDINGTCCSEENPVQYNLEINVFQLKESIMIVLDYTPVYEKQAIEMFGTAFLESLSNAANALAHAEHILTPSDYGENGLSAAELEQLVRKYGRPSKVYALSPMQKNILTVVSLKKDPSMYYERFSFLLNGSLNEEAMERSFAAVTEAHDVFKTFFAAEGLSEPVQIVEEHGRPDFELTECDGDSKEAAERLLARDRAAGFDIFHGQLIRMRLIRFAEDCHYMMISFHHIILDGWCLSMVLNEIFDCYHDLASGKQPVLREQYTYSEYIRQCFRKNRYESLQYWKECLKGLDGAVELPFHKNSSEPYRQAGIVADLQKDVIRKLSAVAKAARATESMVFQAVWALLLAEYAGDDVVFGCVVSGRDPQIEGMGQMLGLFINTIPMRVTPDREEKFLQLVSRIRKSNAEASGHVYLSISDIAQCSGLSPAIIEHALVFENYPVTGGLDMSKTEQDYKQMHISDGSYFEQSVLALSVKIVPGETYRMTFRFDSNQYPERDMKHMAKRYVQLLEQVTETASVADIYGNEEDMAGDFNDSLE